jgi:hypothetical protein
MTIGNDLERMAVNKMILEARETSAHLSNGSGRVEGCQAHGDIAKGLRLCLDLLVCLLTATTNPRKHAAWSGAAAFIAVLIVEVVRLIMERHGVTLPKMAGGAG